MSAIVIIFALLAEILLLAWLPVLGVVLPITAVTFIHQVEFLRRRDIVLLGLIVGNVFDILIGTDPGQYLFAWAMLAGLSLFLRAKEDKANMVHKLIVLSLFLIFLQAFGAAFTSGISFLDFARASLLALLVYVFFGSFVFISSKLIGSKT